MKIRPIGAIPPSRTISVPPSPVTQRLNAVRRGLRQHGAVSLKNNELDQKVIERLKNQFGAENVVIEKSNTLKVSVKNFKK